MSVGNLSWVPVAPGFRHSRHRGDVALSLGARASPRPSLAPERRGQGISASNHTAVRWREVPPAGQAQGQGLAGAGESWERGLLAESEGYELLTLFIPSTPSRLCHRHTRTPAFTARAFLPLFMCCLRNYTFYFNFKIYMSYIFMSHRYNKTF